MSDIDEQAYIEQFLADITCDWCGQAATTVDWQTGKHVSTITRRYRERVEQRAGYTLRHWKVWQVCQQCELGSWWTDGSWAKVPDLMLGLEQKKVVSGLLERYYEGRVRPDPRMPVAFMPGPYVPLQVTPDVVPEVPVRFHVLKNRFVPENQQPLHIEVDPSIYERLAVDLAVDHADATAAATWWHQTFHVEQKE